MFCVMTVRACTVGIFSVPRGVSMVVNGSSVAIASVVQVRIKNMFAIVFAASFNIFVAAVFCVCIADTVGVK